jgi:hypothetical protein
MWQKLRQTTPRLNPAGEAEVFRKSDRALGLPIMVVIAMNAASIYSNYQLRKSADRIVGDAGNSEMVISQNSLGHSGFCINWRKSHASKGHFQWLAPAAARLPAPLACRKVTVPLGFSLQRTRIPTISRTGGVDFP